MGRPFLNAGIDELEAAFERQGHDPVFARKLIDELQHRTVPRAGRLPERARPRVAEARSASTPPPGTAAPSTSLDTRPPSVLAAPQNARPGGVFVGTGRADGPTC